jgi:repressor of nif and glnA expression
VNPRLVKAAVLDVLSEFQHAVPARTIILALRTLLRVEITLTDLRAMLKSMEESGLVAGTGDPPVWLITGDGRLWLAQPSD